MSSILFVDSNYSYRGHFAEAFARRRISDDIDIASVGTADDELDPLAVEVMREIGIDISSQNPKSFADVKKEVFDVVIALCNCSFKDCPVLPGNPAVINWSFPCDSMKNSTEQKTIEFYREMRDKIKQEVDDFFEKGYFAAFFNSKTDSQMVLDNISDTIIAHDLNRSIFYFNSAAEELTGFKREEVLNRDCHEAFGAPLCGDKCMFCSGESNPEIPDKHTRTMQLTNKSGEKRICEMTTTLMHDSNNVAKGVLAVIRDLSTQQNLSKYATGVERFSGIIGASPEIMAVLNSISDIANSKAPVMIFGESGTGKELAARAIHEQSSRKDRLFVPLNCGALPENLLESELFGHVRGAFTGAVRDKKGRFELADGGTIFLDEIGDISPAMQVKLLRVLQEGTFERIGGEKTFKVDVRVISATNKDLNKEMAEGRFREDLFYRLNVVPLTLPSLRERGSDVIVLAEYFLANAAQEAGRGRIHFSAPVIDLFLAYDWPGNIRELQNWIQYALLKCKGDVIELSHLPASSNRDWAAHNVSIESPPPVKKRRKRKLNKIQVQEALNRTGGNKQKAAKLLGVGRATLYRFINSEDR